MTIRVVTHNDVTDACGLAELTPYPAVVQGTNATVSSAVGADGKTTYTVSVSNADIVNAVEAGIAADQGAQTAIADAIGDEIVDKILSDSTILNELKDGLDGLTCSQIADFPIVSKIGG
jgi:hypothetical protein